MNLTSILLIATAVLSLISGIIFLAGSVKNSRWSGFWVFMISLGCTIWAFGCGSFLALPVGADVMADWSILCIYLGGMLLALSVLVYAAWWCYLGKYRILSRLYVIVCAVFAAFLGVILIYDRSVLYDGITLSNAGNAVHLYWGWYYIAYCIFFAMAFCGFWICQFINARKARTKQVRKGAYVLFFGFLVTALISGFYNVLLPPSNYSLIWVGPLSMDIVLLAFFYSTLRYRMIAVSSHWLRLLAYGVTILSGVIIYMVIFYIIFTALFKIPNPSSSILVLNFLMIVIVLLLIPVINEINAALRSMIMVGQVDLAYVIKKLNRIATKNVDLRELAAFLADHLHFAYIGILINGRLYGSKALSISAGELEKIGKLRPAAAGGVWQEPNEAVQKILDELDLKAIAELKNAKGKPFGQLIVGRPLGKASFERRDLVQLEMIINLVATVIDSEKHIRA